MKTHTLITSAKSALVLAAALLAFAVQSQASVIFSDNFTGSGTNSLGGQTTTTGGGVWQGATDDAIMANGSFAGTGQKWLNWTPSSGFVYDLKVTIPSERFWMLKQPTQVWAALVTMAQETT
jgi:hypothetical protein